MHTYLRYVPTATFGLVASPQCTDLLLDHQGKMAFTAALEDVAAFNLRAGTPVRTMRPPGPTLDDPETDVSNLGEVTSLALSPDGATVAVGYHAGVINLFAVRTGALQVTLHGHRSAVTSLHYSKGGTVLASGGRDTDVILWDLVTESGLYRLKGHKDGVNGVVLLEQDGHDGGGGGGGVPSHAVSVSKDALVKVWDLATQHCVQTLTGHRSEVWSVEVSPDGRRMVTGAADRQLRVWSLFEDGGDEEDGEAKGDEEPNVCAYMGSVLRESNDRCLNLKYGAGGRLLAAQDVGKLVDVYKVRSEAEAKKKMKRRFKRAREKRQQKKKGDAGEGEDGPEDGNAWGMPMNGHRKPPQGQDNDAAADEEEGEQEERLMASDELEWLVTVRASHRVRGTVFAASTGSSTEAARLLLSLANNSLEMYAITTLAKAANGVGAEYSKIMTLDGPGHRSDVRALALSSDDSMVASTCSNQLKVWSRVSDSRGNPPQCLRTTALEKSFGLCVVFLPGDRHVVVGSKEGKLHLVDLATGDILETHGPPAAATENEDAEDKENEDEEGEGGVLHDGHTAAVWSMDVRPDGKGMMTGGADKEVRFWDFELSTAPGGHLRLVHVRTLKLNDDVMAVRYSRTKDPERLLVAVALLDSTVKVFYDNSLRFFLSLYGHKLPVMGLDISDDNELIATASADKTVKIWGLDFGDCHRSLLAHQDTVMSLRFIPGTHCFFTASKDKTIKYWDADHFEHILTHRGHQAEVWGLAMASDGSFFASCGHDRSLRVWERSDDQVYLEEERTRELETMFESEVERDNRGGGMSSKKGEEEDEDKEGEGGPGEESAVASRRSLESVKHAERLGEALDVAAADEAVDEEHAKRAGVGGAPCPPNPLMLGLSAPRYILFHLRLVKGPDLEQALLVLTLDAMQRLLRYLIALLKENVEVELCWRCVLFLLKTHHHQLLHCRDLVPALAELRGMLKERLRTYRDGLAMNSAGLKLLKREIEEDKNAFVIAPETPPPPAGAAAAAAGVVGTTGKKPRKR